MATDFFALAQAAATDGAPPFQPRAQNLYDYIEHYWKKDAARLAEGFDLEEFFTLLQLQMSDAIRRNDPDKYKILASVYDQITNWLTSYLADFEGAPVYRSPVLHFGRMLLREAATVITFNYDCIIEDAIANASGVSHRRDVHSLTFSHYNWNRALCYGIRFDEVEPFRAGPPQPIPGETFYNQPGNDLYPNPILKLHGSINWHRYAPVRAIPQIIPDHSPAPTGSILQVRSTPSGLPNIRGGWMTERVLVTPVLYKQELLRSNIFDTLWQRALTELTGCRTLVVVGYSFPPTDFPTKRLFLEAFAARPPLDELTVVNPDPTRLTLIRELTHHGGSIRSVNTLEDFLASA